MIAEHRFEIGSSCEYALSDSINNTFAYALACKARVASPDVEFGIRALALGARETLRIVRGTFLSCPAFGTLAIGKASAMFPIFPLLNAQALDATLNVVWVKGDRASAYIFGEGLFFHKTAKSTRIVQAKFIPNEGSNEIKPAYLSCTLDPQRSEDASGFKEILDCVRDVNGESGIPVIRSALQSVPVEVVVGQGDVVGVVGCPVDDWRSMLSSLIDLKTSTAGFPIATIHM